MKDIRDLPGLQHIVGIAVRSEPRQDAAVHKLHCGRAAAGIPHIGLRIVNHHAAAFLDEPHLVGVNIDAVREQGLFAEDIPVEEAVDDALSVLL